MPTKTRECDCTHEYQDRIYGKKQRLHNEGKEGKSQRCTVCGKVKVNGGGVK